MLYFCRKYRDNVEWVNFLTQGIYWFAFQTYRQPTFLCFLWFDYNSVSLSSMRWEINQVSVSAERVLTTGEQEQRSHCSGPPTAVLSGRMVWNQCRTDAPKAWLPRADSALCLQAARAGLPPEQVHEKWIEFGGRPSDDIRIQTLMDLWNNHYLLISVCESYPNAG